MARSLEGTTTHYHTLGVAPAAAPDEVRRAYHALARALHPDRHVRSAPGVAAAASERMRDVNAAWEVLSDPAARELYDVDLALDARRTAPVAPVVGGSASGWSAPPAPGAAQPEPSPARGAPSLARGLLWLTVLGVLGFIFVFTAYAASDSDGDGVGGVGAGVDATSEPSAAPTTVLQNLQRGECVRMAPRALDVVDCTAPHDFRVVDVLPYGRPCPGGTQAIYLPAQRENACLEAG